MLIRIFTVTIIIFLAVLNGLSDTQSAAQDYNDASRGKVEVIYDEVEIEWLPEVQVDTNFDEIEAEYVATKFELRDGICFEVIASIR